MWVATQALVRSRCHPFYTRLNQILDQPAFGRYVEWLCQRCYANEIGHPGLPLGRYFRLLLLGRRILRDCPRVCPEFVGQSLRNPH
jgi:hypothetical protein